MQNLDSPVFQYLKMIYIFVYVTKTLIFSIIFTGTCVQKGGIYIIHNGTLLKDIKKMSDAQQTSALESFHSITNRFALKMKAYKYHGMLSSRY